jgi:hypothetical protein
MESLPMANREHLEILKKGVKAWNQWRKQNPKVRPDLSEVHLGLGEGTVFFGNLDVSLVGSPPVGYADLRGLNLAETDLLKTNLYRADLSDGRLSGANLFRANLTEANLRQAELSMADLTAARIFEANLREAYLPDAKLNRADLRRVDFLEANLSGVELRGANLYGAKFRDANLQSSDFSNAEMLGTTFANIDLSTVNGLDTVHHEGPSTIGIDTIYRSQGKIPEAFLRGAGVPDDFIVYMRSLVASPIEFYSCFISHSGKDKKFAERLHADLQMKGVRCWFAHEHMKIGDEIRPRIDESIRHYDKLLIVLSENSINSNWVQKEVETAFEKEQRQNKPVLFPIRLDDSVMQTDEAWAADIRRMRHIGDFTKWKDHDSYQKAFGQLLRDLKAEKAEAKHHEHRTTLQRP